jgi:hypothetical protein
MASNKIKFEMTLKDLSFKFEGDYEQGQRIQTGITRALSDIANIQSNAMGAKPAALIDLQPANVPPSRRKRKRKQDGDAEADSPADGNGDSESHGGGSQRRSSTEAPTQLLLGLRKAGFFETARTASHILGHLATKGHTGLGHSDLTSPLSKLCQRDVLVRSKPDHKTWHYANGSKDE